MVIKRVLVHQKGRLQPVPVGLKPDLLPKHSRHYLVNDLQASNYPWFATNPTPCY